MIVAVQIRFLGKETTKGDSPTLYATDRDSYIVQGWKVDDRDLQNAGHDDICVEIWTTLFRHLAADGLHGDPETGTYPVVTTTGLKTCIIAGAPVTDTRVREQMRMPEHEDCVEVTKAAMKDLLRERENRWT